MTKLTEKVTEPEKVTVNESENVNVNESENVNVNETVTETANENASKNSSQNDALLKAIRAGKTFNLLRRAFYSESKNRTFYTYSMFLILPGRRKMHVQVDFNPDIGYIGKDDKSKKISGNSTSFQLLNWLYDSGAGLKLKVRAIKKDGAYQYTKSGDIELVYSAVCEDELTGLETTVEIVPSTVAQDKFCRLALCGFAGCREYNDNDFLDTPGLQDAFENMRLPGDYDD